MSDYSHKTLYLCIIIFAFVLQSCGNMVVTHLSALSVSLQTTSEPLQTIKTLFFLSAVHIFHVTGHRKLHFIERFYVVHTHRHQFALTDSLNSKHLPYQSKFLLFIHQCLSACIHVCVMCCDPTMKTHVERDCRKLINESSLPRDLNCRYTLQVPSLRSAQDFTARPHPMSSVLFTAGQV